MPKLKICPKCGTEHTKRGDFCSRSCGNAREHTEQDKQKRRKKLIEYHQTPEGLATQEKSRKQMIALNKGESMDIINSDDYAVDIPDLTDYNEFYDTHWQRAEKW